MGTRHRDNPASVNLAHDISGKLPDSFWERSRCCFSIVAMLSKIAINIDGGVVNEGASRTGVIQQAAGEGISGGEPYQNR